MKPAWLGITGWLIVLLGLVLGLTAAAPLNGATLIGCLMVAGGGFMVGRQVSTHE